MKTTILTLTTIILFLTAGAGDKKYTETMQKNIDLLYKAESLKDYQQTANNFERIANAEKKEWLPNYYAAMSYINMSFMVEDPGKKDQFLDLAQGFLKKTEKMDSEKSEVTALQGLLYQGRIMADPASRGMQYGPMAYGAFEKAKGINPDNPRVYYLMGMNLYNTPEAFGGGKEAACSMFNTAKEKYESMMPQKELYPSWGMEDNERMLGMCGK